MAEAATKPTNNLGIVGWWPLNEGTSTIAHDISGYGYDGVLNGSTWTNGKKGKALNFNGSDSRVTVTSTALNKSGSIAISAWIKLPSTSSNNVITIRGNTSQVVPWAWFYYMGSTNTLALWNANGNGASVSNVISVEDSRWHHVMVSAGSGETIRFYVDGVDVTPVSGNNTYLDPATSVAILGTYPFEIGARTHTTGILEDFVGDIDDVRVYNRTITSTEVLALYNSGQVTRQTVSQSGLAGWWTFDEATSTIAHDFSGQNNAGTLISSPTWTSGKKGSAMQFSSLRYVTVANMPAISNTTISVSAWIYPTTYSGYNVIASQRNGCGAASFQVHLDSNTGFLAFWGSNLYISTYKPPLNTWTHVNATFNAGTVTLYANGVQVGSTSGITRDSAQTLFRIGTDGTCGNPFNGKIDDVRVYSRALSDAEISDLYRQNQTEVGGSRETSVSDGLVGYWPFNGKDISWTTGRVYDRSGNNNSGIITSLGTTSAPAAGAIGQALSFNGSTSLITVPYSAVLAPTAGVSFGGWFKTTNKALAQRIVSKTETGGYTLALNEGSNCTDLCALVRVGGAYHAVTAPLSSITNNKWHHVMATYDGETSVMYLDGVQTGSNATPSGAIQYATTNPLCIGREPSGAACDQFTDLFNGALDEIRVYNRALSASEVKRLYNLGK